MRIFFSPRSDPFMREFGPVVVGDHDAITMMERTITSSQELLDLSWTVKHTAIDQDSGTLKFARTPVLPSQNEL